MTSSNEEPPALKSWLEKNPIPWTRSRDSNSPRRRQLAPQTRREHAFPQWQKADMSPKREREKSRNLSFTNRGGRASIGIENQFASSRRGGGVELGEWRGLVNAYHLTFGEGHSHSHVLGEILPLNGEGRKPQTQFCWRFVEFRSMTLF